MHEPEGISGKRQMAIGSRIAAIPDMHVEKKKHGKGGKEELAEKHKLNLIKIFPKDLFPINNLSKKLEKINLTSKKPYQPDAKRLTA